MDAILLQCRWMLFQRKCTSIKYSIRLSITHWTCIDIVRIRCVRVWVSLQYMYSEYIVLAMYLEIAIAAVQRISELNAHICKWNGNVSHRSSIWQFSIDISTLSLTQEIYFQNKIAEEKKKNQRKTTVLRHQHWFQLFIISQIHKHYIVRHHHRCVPIKCECVNRILTFRLQCALLLLLFNSIANFNVCWFDWSYHYSIT